MFTVALVSLGFACFFVSGVKSGSGRVDNGSQSNTFNPSKVGERRNAWRTLAPRIRQTGYTNLSILQRNPTVWELCKRIYSRDILEEVDGVWKIRNETEPLVQHTSIRSPKVALLAVRTLSGQWYGFVLGSVPHEFRVFCLRLPLHFEYDSKRFSYDGTYWYITTRLDGPSRIVAQSKPECSVLQVLTDKGRWHKIPNKGKMLLVIKYAARLPVMASNRNVGQWHNNMIHRVVTVNNESYFAIKRRDGTLHNFVAFGGGVIFAKSSKRKWYIFKDPPTKFANFMNHKRAEIVGFDMEHF